MSGGLLGPRRPMSRQRHRGAALAQAVIQEQRPGAHRHGQDHGRIGERGDVGVGADRDAQASRMSCQSVDQGDPPTEEVAGSRWERHSRGGHRSCTNAAARRPGSWSNVTTPAKLAICRALVAPTRGSAHSMKGRLVDRRVYGTDPSQRTEQADRQDPTASAADPQVQRAQLGDASRRLCEMPLVEPPPERTVVIQHVGSEVGVEGASGGDRHARRGRPWLREARRRSRARQPRWRPPVRRDHRRSPSPHSSRAVFHTGGPDEVLQPDEIPVVHLRLDETAIACSIASEHRRLESPAGSVGATRDVLHHDGVTGGRDDTSVPSAAPPRSAGAVATPKRIVRTSWRCLPS